MKCNNSSCFCQWRMLSLRFDRSDAKSKRASLDTFFFGCTRTIHSWAQSIILYFFSIKGGQMLFWTRQHPINGLHIQRQRGTVLFVQMLSPVRYIQPLVNWRTIMKHRDERKYYWKYFIHFFVYIFGGSLASLGIHEYTPLLFRSLCISSLPYPTQGR